MVAMWRPDRQKGHNTERRCKDEVKLPSQDDPGNTSAVTSHDSQLAQRANGAAETGEKEQRWEDGRLADQTLIADDGRMAAERRLVFQLTGRSGRMSGQEELEFHISADDAY